MPANRLRPGSLLRFSPDRLWSRLIHSMCLIGWMVSAEGLGPTFCSWLAELDPLHEVSVTVAADGTARIVLSHENLSDVIEAHSPLITTLLAIGRASSNGDQDHVLDFHPLDDGRHGKARELPAPALLIVDLHLSAPVPARLEPSSVRTVKEAITPPASRVMRC